MQLLNFVIENNSDEIFSDKNKKKSKSPKKENGKIYQD